MGDRKLTFELRQRPPPPPQAARKAPLVRSAADPVPIGGTVAASRAWWACCVIITLGVVVGLVLIGVALANTGHHHHPTPVPTAVPTAAPTVRRGSSAAPLTTTPSIVLTAVCNVVRDDGTCLAVFSYRNTHTSGAVDSVDLVAPRDNVVGPLRPLTAQPSTFARGFHFGAASYAWLCGEASSYTRWTLRDAHGRTSVAVLNAAPLECPSLSQVLAAVPELQ